MKKEPRSKQALKPRINPKAFIDSLDWLSTWEKRLLTELLQDVDKLDAPIRVRIPIQSFAARYTVSYDVAYEHMVTAAHELMRTWVEKEPPEGYGEHRILSKVDVPGEIDDKSDSNGYIILEFNPELNSCL